MRRSLGRVSLAVRLLEAWKTPREDRSIAEYWLLWMAGGLKRPIQHVEVEPEVLVGFAGSRPRKALAGRKQASVLAVGSLQAHSLTREEHRGYQLQVWR